MIDLLCYCAGVSVADAARGLQRDAGRYCRGCLGDLKVWLQRRLGLRRRPLCFVPDLESVAWYERPDDGRDHYVRLFDRGAYTVTHGRREMFETYAWWSPLPWVRRVVKRQYIHAGMSVLLLNLSTVRQLGMAPRGARLVTPRRGWAEFRGRAWFALYVVGPGRPRTIQHVK